MAFPEKYSSVQLPKKMPPKKVPMNPKQLIALGKTMAFLEQTVSQQLTQAMTEIGTKRVKYPSLSNMESALMHLACYLKVLNLHYLFCMLALPHGTVAHVFDVKLSHFLFRFLTGLKYEELGLPDRKIHKEARNFYIALRSRPKIGPVFQGWRRR